jgi:hypothetical protein
MMNTERLTILETDEDEANLASELRSYVINNDYKLDDSVEDWADSEFNRIYVLYHYADVTKVN